MLFLKSFDKDQYSNKDEEAEMKRIRQDEAKGDIKALLDNYQQELEKIKAEKRAQQKEIEGQEGGRTMVS